VPSSVLILWFLLATVVWLVFAWYSWRVYHNPKEEGDILVGFAWDAIRVYCRIYHGMKIIGRQHIPRASNIGGRPVVVVANHTSGLDPILLQSSCPWYIRWMMAADMTGVGLDWLWEFTGVILVDRSGKAEIGGVRTALATLRSHVAVGIFPEGKLRTSLDELNSFLPGVGLIVARADALILPAVIRGTPFHSTSWGSLVEPSRSTVEFHPLIDTKALGLKSSEIAPYLEARYRQWMAPIGAGADQKLLPYAGHEINA